MTRHPNVEQHFFLRSARGDEYHAYAALLAEADAVHHGELPGLIKAPDQAQPPEAAFLAVLNDPDRLLDVAVDGREIVGLIEASILERAGNRVFGPSRMTRVDLVVVKESHRRRGIGRALLRRARTWAKEKGTEGVMLDAYAFNLVAARLYEKAGFDVLKKTYVQSFTAPRAT